MGAGYQYLSTGGIQTLLAATTLTSSYQIAAPTTSDGIVSIAGVDLKSYDSVTVSTRVTSPESGTSRVANLIYEWSKTGTTWFPETTDVATGTVAPDYPVTPYRYRRDISLDSAAATYLGADIIRFRRLARFFRVQYKSSATTTAMINMTYLLENNAN